MKSNEGKENGRHGAPPRLVLEVALALIAAAVAIVISTASSQSTGTGHQGNVESVGPLADLAAMVASADIIVIGELDSIVKSSTFTGYNAYGTAIPVPTWTTTIIQPTHTPRPYNAVPFTDFFIDDSEIIKDDAPSNPLILRRLRSLLSNATQVAVDIVSDYPMGQVGEEYLFFLNTNPDSTYGLRHGPWDRLIISGEEVTYSDGDQTPVPFASGMTPSEFVQAVRDEVN